MKIFAILILSACLPANARPTEDPAKNYLSIHVGLWPVDYNLYEYDAAGQGTLRDSYRYFGPAIEAAYGRRINDFLALEGRGFLALITGSDIPPDVSPSNYRSTRYGVSAGAVVTPLGRLFRFAQAGILLGYSREDTRETLRHVTGIYHYTESHNRFAISYPLRLLAWDNRRFSLGAEANLQTQFHRGDYYLRSVHYSVLFRYKF